MSEQNKQGQIPIFTPPQQTFNPPSDGKRNEKRGPDAPEAGHGFQPCPAVRDYAGDYRDNGRRSGPDVRLEVDLWKTMWEPWFASSAR